jgi:hypothetical protein
MMINSNHYSKYTVAWRRLRMTWHIYFKILEIPKCIPEIPKCIPEIPSSGYFSPGCHVVVVVVWRCQEV